MFSKVHIAKITFALTLVISANAQAGRLARKLIRADEAGISSLEKSGHAAADRSFQKGHTVVAVGIDAATGTVVDMARCLNAGLTGLERIDEELGLLPAEGVGRLVIRALEWTGHLDKNEANDVRGYFAENLDKLRMSPEFTKNCTAVRVSKEVFKTLNDQILLNARRAITAPAASSVVDSFSVPSHHE